VLLALFKEMRKKEYFYFTIVVKHIYIINISEDRS